MGYENRIKPVYLLAFLFFFMSFMGCSGSESGSAAAQDGPPRDSTPVVLVPEAANIDVVQNEKAVLDYSNASKGYLCATSLISPTVVKVLVDFAGTQYQYTLSGTGFDVIPLSCGDGLYSVSLWENVYDDQYAAIFSQDIQVQLEDQFLPFLYPNQFVNFSSGDNAVALSGELAAGATGVVQAIEKIYGYVVKNIDYDFDKAANVKPGYLPVPDQTLQSQSGICFDYAVLTAAMLRAQGIPTKLVVGYAGAAYHAWIDVYSNEEGWIRKEIYFDGQDYVLMDPTFASAGNGKADVSQFVGDGSNYNPRFVY
jgi:transglutaminase-like putative cysteine protease